MIEILPGVFYYPELAWYQQDEQLIALANEVMQTPTIDSEIETAGSNSRMIYGEWENTTIEGTFTMRVDMHYLYSISHGAFLSKSSHDDVTITQI